MVYEMIMITSEQCVSPYWSGDEDKGSAIWEGKLSKIKCRSVVPIVCQEQKMGQGLMPFSVITIFILLLFIRISCKTLPFEKHPKYECSVPVYKDSCCSVLFTVLQ